MKAAELLVRSLEKEGVQYIFGLPGEENMAVLDALIGSTIQFIPVRHEQGGAFMADVYGRLTGKAGVCMSTLGPGATNLMTGVADANLDSAPLVAITGQVSTKTMHKESHQYLDLVSMFRPVTKWNTQIAQRDTVGEVVRKAFKLAESEKPGATHIDLPEDIADLPVREGHEIPLNPQSFCDAEAADVCIRHAAKLISQARNPMILAGNGVIRAKATAALIHFAETLNIPVTNTFMGKGAIPYTHPLSLWTVGLQARDYIAFGFDQSDLIIAVGYDLIEYGPTKWNPEHNSQVIHVSMTPSEVDRDYMPEVEVVGAIATSLERIISYANRSEHAAPAALNLRPLLWEDYTAEANDTSFPLKPQKVIYDLRQVLRSQDILISDVGAHKMWIARHYHAIEPNTCLISNGFAAMGIALPGAIAAKLVYPERKVVAVTGDGGFMMNMQELETAVRVGTAFVVLIFNDGGYGLIEWKQEVQYGRSAFVKFGNPDFVALAEAMGVKGYRINSAAELVPTLKRALAQEVPVVIDCPVDYRENAKLTKKLGELSVATLGGNV
ncbi:acetolactate synthase large subunit [Leptolyngbya sp. FACHB-261]|uniref:acetolactate synthase large subunit n=1 Tax=Leptolyngbya sp. FACHB-261 TaxID=2692806 RepID=UPI001683CB2A|nr:acetolactate synthase large subunit [Leptolyngbya sp. FACHB-261]MBD2101301.1 acetolactate synthase large subunit [Leptolyngbya sp. FACHB-261]